MSSGGRKPALLQYVEALVEKHTLYGDRRRNDVGLYKNEKDILLGMITEIEVAIQVRFKLPGQDKEVIFCETESFNDEVVDGRSFILFNQDDMS